jgi:hypothetical protein
MKHLLRLTKCTLNKGYFPYDYLNDYNKLNETELPPHEAFFNKLKNKILLMKSIKFVWMHGMKTT